MLFKIQFCDSYFEVNSNKLLYVINLKGQKSYYFNFFYVGYELQTYNSKTHQIFSNHFFNLQSPDISKNLFTGRFILLTVFGFGKTVFKSANPFSVSPFR